PAVERDPILAREQIHDRAGAAGQELEGRAGQRIDVDGADGPEAGADAAGLRVGLAEAQGPATRAREHVQHVEDAIGHAASPSVAVVVAAARGSYRNSRGSTCPAMARATSAGVPPWAAIMCAVRRQWPKACTLMQ